MRHGRVAFRWAEDRISGKVSGLNPYPARPMKTARSLTVILTAVLALAGLVACSGSSNSGTYNQAFNVSGQWSGTIKDTVYGEALVTMTLSDNGGAVTGNMVTFGPNSCFTGFSVSQLTGTAAQLPANTSGDNFFTADQENSNSGSVVLSMTVDETLTTVDEEGEEEEETTTYTVSFALAGNSDNLTGNWGGTWFGPLPVSANFCRYPGRQGSIVIQRI